MGAIATSKSELRISSAMDKIFHVVDESDQHAELMLDFEESLTKKSKSSYNISKMKCNDGDYPNVEYEPDPEWHFLTHSSLEVVLPHMVPKNGQDGLVKFCWCHNLAHNLIENAEFSVDGVACQTLSSTWLDIRSQFFADKSPGAIEQYERNIGNRSGLVKWQTESLPETTLLLEQPWFYSESGSKAFPLFLNGGSSKYTHSYTFCSDIGSLLRAMVLVGEQWYHVTNPLRYLNCYYDGNRTATRIPFLNYCH